MRSEFALSYRFNIFLPQINVHIIAPYLIGVNLGAFWSLPVRWGPFESQMLLSPGWAQHSCNAGVGSVLGRDQGDSNHYLGLVGESWVSVGSVLRVQVQKERRGEKLFFMKTQPAPAAASLSPALAVTQCQGSAWPGSQLDVYLHSRLSVPEGLVLGLFWDRRAGQGDLLNNKPLGAAASLPGVTQSSCHPFPSNLHIKVTQPEISCMSCSWPRPPVQPVLLGCS